MLSSYMFGPYQDLDLYEQFKGVNQELGDLRYVNMYPGGAEIICAVWNKTAAKPGPEHLGSMYPRN